MKSLRNIKLRTHCQDTAELVFRSAKNPLKEDVEVDHLSTSSFLDRFKIPVDFERDQGQPYVQKKFCPSFISLSLLTGYSWIKRSNAPWHGRGQ
jgi:hypothetical protein